MKHHFGETATVELSPRWHDEDLASATERNWGTHSRLHTAAAPARAQPSVVPSSPVRAPAKVAA